MRDNSLTIRSHTHHARLEETFFTKMQMKLLNLTSRITTVQTGII